MKKLMIILVISIVFNSCCTNGVAVSRSLIIQYVNITESSVNYTILRTERNDITNIIDTSEVGLLTSQSNYRLSIPFLENNISTNYIFFIENTNYRDTITDIYFEIETKKCKGEKIVKFEYKLNGVTHTDMEIFIE